MADDSAASLLFKIGANSDDAQENVARFRTLFSKNIGQLKEEFHSFAAEITGGGEKIATSLPALAGIAAGAIVGLGGALFELAKKTAEQGEEFELMSQETGIAVSQLSGLKVIAGEAGIPFDTLTNGVMILDRGLSPVASSSATAGKALQMLGISANKAGGGMKDNITLMSEIADKFKGMKDGSDKAALAMSLFGRSGAAMIPVLDKGGAAIRGAAQHAKEMGMTFTDVSAHQSVEFLESFRDIKYTIEGLGVTLGQKVLPYITDAMKGFASFILSNSGAISEAISSIGYVFKGLWFVIKLDLKELMAAIALVTGTVKEMAHAFVAAWDAIHGRWGKAKQDLVDMKGTAIETWQGIKQAFKGGSAESSDALEELGKMLSNGFKPKATAATQAADKFASSLAMATSEIEQMQDQMSKPEAAIQNQFLRAQQAAEKELEGYKKLAAAGKITRAQLGQYEREYSELVVDLAKERELKLKNLAQQRTQSVAQLDQALQAKLAGFTAGTLATKKAAIEKEIADEKAKYKKLGALDAAHEKMIEQLRADLLHKLDQQEAAAAEKRQQKYQTEFDKLAAITGSYEQKTLTAKQKIQIAYNQEIQKVRQLEQELLKMARTEQQRAQITKEAGIAIQAAYKKEQVELNQLGTAHKKNNQQEMQLYNQSTQAIQKYTKQYNQAVQMLIKALEKQLATELTTQKTSVTASNTTTAMKGKNIGMESAWKGAKEFAEGLASLASLDFAGAAAHFAASGSFLSVAASVGVAAAGLLSGGGSSGGGGGSRAARSSSGGSSRGSGGSSASGGSGGGSVVNVHIDGVISADNLQQVMDQINSSVAKGSGTMTATHVVAAGAVVPVPQGAF